MLRVNNLLRKIDWFNLLNKFSFFVLFGVVNNFENILTVKPYNVTWMKFCHPYLFMKKMVSYNLSDIVVVVTFCAIKKYMSSENIWLWLAIDFWLFWEIMNGNLTKLINYYTHNPNKIINNLNYVIYKSTSFFRKYKYNFYFNV